MSVAQQEFITGEIDRRMAAERVWVTESLAGTVASSVADATRAVEEQFLKERTTVSEAAAVFEARINQTLIASIDGRIEDVTSRVTAQFVSENAGMRALIAELQVVMEGIGGERFQEVALKMADLDSTMKGHIQAMASMLQVEVMALRTTGQAHDNALRAHDTALREINGKIVAPGFAQGDQGSGPRL